LGKCCWFVFSRSSLKELYFNSVYIHIYEFCDSLCSSQYEGGIDHSWSIHHSSLYLVFGLSMIRRIYIFNFLSLWGFFACLWAVMCSKADHKSIHWQYRWRNNVTTTNITATSHALIGIYML
jgi:hypothetical protein